MPVDSHFEETRQRVSNTVFAKKYKNDKDFFVMHSDGVRRISTNMKNIS